MRFYLVGLDVGHLAAQSGGEDIQDPGAEMVDAMPRNEWVVTPLLLAAIAHGPQLHAQAFRNKRAPHAVPENKPGLFPPPNAFRMSRACLERGTQMLPPHFHSSGPEYARTLR